MSTKEGAVSSSNAIGEFIIQFSRLEHVLRLFVGYALKLELINFDVFDTVVRSYDFAMLCNIVEKLAKTLPQYENERENIKKVVNDAKKINDDRVGVAHGTWGWQLGASHMARGSLKTPRFFEKADELKKLSEKTAKTAHDMLEIMIRVRDASPPSIAPL